MESSLWSVLVFTLAIIGAVNSAKVDDEVANVASKTSGADSDQVNGPLEQRLLVLEAELRRVKSHLSAVENLLDAWFLSAEQQQPSMIVNGGADARWLEADNGNRAVKRAGGGGYAFMGSRGKRKQPFILGSRGKRAVNYENEPESPVAASVGNEEPASTADFESIVENGNENENEKNDMDKRGNYFYGNRGKKQFVTGSLDDTEYRMPPFTNKRYTFMGSRGKK